VRASAVSCTPYAAGFGTLGSTRIVRRPNHERLEGFGYILRKIDRSDGGNGNTVIVLFEQ